MLLRFAPAKSIFSDPNFEIGKLFAVLPDFVAYAFATSGPFGTHRSMISFFGAIWFANSTGPYK
jgi:hypothetical protein